jgi:hypothetical protein
MMYRNQARVSAAYWAFSYAAELACHCTKNSVGGPRAPPRLPAAVPRGRGNDGRRINVVTFRCRHGPVLTCACPLHLT